MYSPLSESRYQKSGEQERASQLASQPVNKTKTKQKQEKEEEEGARTTIPKTLLGWKKKRRGGSLARACVPVDVVISREPRSTKNQGHANRWTTTGLSSSRRPPPRRFNNNHTTAIFSTKGQRYRPDERDAQKTFPLEKREQYFLRCPYIPPTFYTFCPSQEFPSPTPQPPEVPQKPVPATRHHLEIFCKPLRITTASRNPTPPTPQK